MINTSPETFFVHWFGTGKPRALARAVRSGLDKADYPKGS
jgi:queuine/archaeosine tRNA-ribosyltransferase